MKELINALQDCRNGKWNIRVQMDEQGNPWFLAMDVCECLDIRNHKDAIASLDDCQKRLFAVGNADPKSPDGKRQRGEQMSKQMIFVSQGGLYALTFKSRKPEARAFQLWVTDDLLPQIHRYGCYLPGCTEDEGVRYLWRRWAELRAQLIARDEAMMQTTGLRTARAFCEERHIPMVIVPIIAACARLAHRTTPLGRRVYTRRGPRMAYPPEMLQRCLPPVQLELPAMA